ncbi:ELWxxDGT repeat protein [Archangium sp.]|jgi:ELWxxDGT repeat protein|uniref:ELWxxDGT repeat protein n=1 Tax=Archangium sp. TaxID=1872627 RepID=UPI002EDA3E51
MRSFRGTAGWLALALAAVGGCTDSSPEADKAPEAHLGRRGDALSLGTAELVKDILPAPAVPGPTAASEPRDFLWVGDTLYFTATDALHGRELWASDGTAAGTRLVLDIAPASMSAEPTVLTQYKGYLYFIARDDVSQRLWRSDGTAAGTQPFGPESLDFYEVTEMVVIDGTLYLAAGLPSPMSGLELWKSDGRREGTVRVADAAAGGPMFPQQIRDVDGTLFFIGEGMGTGRELWKSDGTQEGTQLVKDLNPGTSGSEFSTDSPMVVVGKTLYFIANGKLWKSDGTESGTVLVQNALRMEPSFPHQLTRVGETFYFVAQDWEAGHELWKSDGTPEGTGVVKDILPGWDSGELLALRDVGGVLYFTANDGETGRELWKSDGTREGTVRLTDLQPGSADSVLSELVVANSGMYFFAAGSTSGQLELRRYDVKSDATSLLRSYKMPASWYGKVQSASSGGTLVFAADAVGLGLEPWKTDGTPEGTVLLKDVEGSGTGSGSQPKSLTDLGGTLLFSARGPSGGVELWKSDGTTAGTERVKGGFQSITTSSTMKMVSMGGVMYFEATTAEFGSELWRSDGTEAGTWLVKDISTGKPSSNPTLTVVLDGKLFFTAMTPTTGGELWVTDGTPEGTRMVKDINPGTAWSTISVMTVWNGAVWFAAQEAASGRELWKSDGTLEGTVRVLDMRPGTASSSPGPCTVVNGSLVFPATDTTGKRLLWKLDAGSTTPQQVTVSAPGVITEALDRPTLVDGRLFFFSTDFWGDFPALWTYDGKSTRATLVSPGGFGRSVVYVASTGKKLLFRGFDEAYGHELWASDGTAAGTRMLKDVFPGPLSGVEGIPMLGLASRGLVLFRGTDGTYGQELWVSDGTEEGTHRLGDVGPGARSSGVERYALSGNNLFFNGNDGTHGDELWRVTLPPPPDSTPPTLTCPVAVTVEATSASGATATWADAQVTDDVTASPTVTYSSASGSSFSLGKTSVKVTAKDAAGNESSCSFDVTVRDATAPRVTCPADVEVEASGPDGAFASYEAASASDAVTASPEVTYSQASGSTFPVGRTKVTVTAKDAAANTASCSFHVTVKDSGRPSLTCPVSVVAEATSASGALVMYEAASASDSVSSAAVTYSQASGSEFGLGTTKVVVTAKDVAGNASTCSFDVTVRDATAPVLTCPADLSVEAADGSGAVVSFAAATVKDAVTASPEVTSSHASGSTFAQGETVVTVTAKDAVGNANTCSFRITVKDTVAPAVTCPASMTVEATGSTGAAATFAATATDAVSASAAVTYSHASGSTFPLGTTSVTTTAKDAAGNEATCAFSVTVRDTTAPSLTCPADVEVETREAPGRSVEYPAATASDAVTTSPAVTYSHASGSDFPVGSTLVSVSTQDAAGNGASCSFHVTVKPAAKSDEGGGLGCASTGSSPLGLWGALAMLAWAALRRPSARRS